MKIPGLSIIMPVFNREKYIEETVLSLLAQSFDDFELIIIDDGSTDNSLRIINSFHDPRIKIIENHQNKGIVYSRNAGLKIAKGNFIAPFDSDDIALPDKFEKQIKFLNENPDFGMVVSWVKLIDSKGNPLRKKWKLDADPESIPANLLFRNYFAQPAVVIRKQAVPKGGYKTGYDVGEDYRMWVDIAKKYKTYNLPEYLVYCRQHNDNVSYGSKTKNTKYEHLIYSYLFNRLEIKVDDNVLNSILLIKNDMAIKKKEELSAIENLLVLILKQNKKLNVYNQKQLIKVVSNRWLKVCLKSKYLHFNMLALFLTSKLSPVRINRFNHFNKN